MTARCPAEPRDVAARWRPLTSSESKVADVRLGDAWRELRRVIPTLAVRVAVAADDSDLVQDVVQVLSEAVIRVLRNPDGYTSKTVAVDDGSRSWKVSDDQRPGELWFPDADLDKLRPPPAPGGGPGRGRAFSVQPS